MDYTCGLQNVGNTCYMNSVLQVILNNKFIKNYLLSNKFESDILVNLKKLTSNISNTQNSGTCDNKLENTITYHLNKLLMTMRENEIISPRTMKDVISKKNNMFSGFSQNDCHELLIFLLDSIHEETKTNVRIVYSGCPIEYRRVREYYEHVQDMLKKTKTESEKQRIINEYHNFETENPNDMSIYKAVSHWSEFLKSNYSIISEYLMGTYQSTLACSKCGYVSQKYENFTTISLEIPNTCDSVSVYDCFDQFTCPEFLDETNKYECSECKTKTVGKKNIIIWYTPKTLIIHLKRFKMTQTGCKKIMTRVSYPLELDVSKYIHICRRNNDKYSLSSVIHHYGHFGSGHYVTFNYVPKIGWLEFNDSHVSKMNIDSIDKTIFNNDSYVIVYTKN